MSKSDKRNWNIIFTLWKLLMNQSQELLVNNKTSNENSLRKKNSTQY